MIEEEERKRCIEMAKYYLDTGVSQRKLARIFYISNTSVSMYLNYYLRDIEPKLYEEVQQVLEAKKSEKTKKQKNDKLIIEIAEYFLETGETHKKIGEKFGISKASVSMYLNYYLRDIEPKLYEKVQKVSRKNRDKTKKNKTLTIEIAKYFLKTGETYKKIGKKFGISGPSVSNHLNYYLRDIDLELYEKVQQILRKKTEKLEMNKKIKKDDKLIIEIAKYFLKTGETQEKIGQKYSVSGSSISICLNEYLRKVDLELYEEVQEFKQNRKREAEEKNRQRCIEIAKYFLNNGANQKEIGEKFGIPRTHVSRILNHDLENIDLELYEKVQQRKWNNHL